MKDKHDLVKKAYGDVARRQSSCCCGPSCCGGRSSSAGKDAPTGGPTSPAGESPATTGGPVPEADLGLSCGNPVAFSQLRAGDVVLDLGCGAGKDVFTAAQRVGAQGRVIGVDMTPEMLSLARENGARFRRATGLSNVEFREGTIERLPVDDASIDIILSNCVINLAPDKLAVFREVARVLRPGGRMVVSDIVLERPLPPELREHEGLYSACIAGALVRPDYLSAIRSAGFASVRVLEDRPWSADSVESLSTQAQAQLAGAAAAITLLAEKAPTR